jgi:hypothetical protein
MRRHLFGSVRLSHGEPVVMHDVERAWRRGYWLLRARSRGGGVRRRHPLPHRPHVVGDAMSNPLVRIRTASAYVAPPPWPIELWVEEDQTWLYRLFNGDGTLLYVGITHSLYRLHSHRRKPWGKTICLVEWEWFRRRKDALAAEAKAIIRERPLMNIAIPTATVKNRHG